MFILCSWPVWYLYVVTLPQSISVTHRDDFCKKIWFTFHLFLKHMQHVCARVLGFPLSCIVLRTLYIYYEWETFAKYCSFFIFVCTARILLFLLLFIYWNWRIKFVFYLHWLSCLWLNTPKRSKYLHNLRKYRRPSLSYCSYRRIGSMVALSITRKSDHTWIC